LSLWYQSSKTSDPRRPSADFFFPFIATFYQIPCCHSLLQQSLHYLAANLCTEFATKYQMASSSSTETNTTTETNPSMTNIPQNPTTPIIPHTPTTPNIP
jgi:hypothetical protein